ncbi:MAG: ABC transporter ATP-binding protein [Alphaproteobacteria bacterium]|nr:ABC transporter ATP-binding protein [Alphaproteobacteria bacterium]
MAKTDIYVTIDDVGRVYPSPHGEVVALQAINLTLHKQEFLSILGPSGCGKSTLLKCLAGLENPSSGKILIGGKPVLSPPDDMGVVFQSDILLDWRNILDNVLLVTEFRRLKRADYLDKAHALLARFGLSGFENRHPWELSGGMRQRASICRALLDDPELLLMDEPFGALDAMTRDDLNLELARLWQDTKKTIMFITHSIPEAVFLSDRIVVMSRNPGRIEEIIDIDLPRPRHLSLRETPEFGKYVAYLRQHFMQLGILHDD